MNKVFEVKTVERVERRYLVQLEIEPPLDKDNIEDLKALAEEEVCTGNQHKFTEGNAEIEEVLSVKEQK